ncbi:MAG: PRC-barrel domain-containing protein [Candidatus Methanospirare jalkutatii]|nr:PRC-barrel domain-containing protein [Candidatus Methanospirare jalkutatii]
MSAMRSGKRRIEREKVIAYRRSKLFPWNFIFEDVEPAAIEHFVPYAVQVLGDLRNSGEENAKTATEAEATTEATEEALAWASSATVRRRMWSGSASSVGASRRRLRGLRREEQKDAEARKGEKERLRERIREEVHLVVSDFLSDTDDEDALRMHGDFAMLFPFAFSQCLVQAMLQKLNLRLEDVIDVRAISELMGVSVHDIRRREDFIRDLLAHQRNMRFLGANIFGKKVMSAEGERIGSVADIIFDAETGVLRGIMVKTEKREWVEESAASAAKEGERGVSSASSANESQFAEKSGEVKRGGVEKRKGLVYLPIQAVRFNSYNGGFVLKSTVF